MPFGNGFRNTVNPPEKTSINSNALQKLTFVKRFLASDIHTTSFVKDVLMKLPKGILK
ncbi:hypothetical protein SAMN04488514_10318 [Kriegella aquimaris]|uniref:Uncharacterized protein n=1 Tax=Kriegella aquimaris TaxID=192904 RepID=A0A1G9N3K1_9FLAO|nr:hypothetical protein SAMN04488514_10318 [Kriegella aquimaris]